MPQTEMTEQTGTEGRTPLADVLEFLPGVAEKLPKNQTEPEQVPETEAEGEENPDVEETDAGDGEETTEDTEGAEATEDTEEEGTDAKTREKIQKRIDKVVAREKAAVQRAEEAEARLREIEAKGAKPAVIVAPTADNPLADVATTKELEAKLDAARQWKRWCIENPQGGEVPAGDGKTEDIDEVRVRKILAQVDDLITVQIPRRAAYLTQQAEHDSEARSVYPDLFQAGEQQVAMNALLQAWPEVQRFSDWKMVLGDYMAGKAAREAKAKQPAKEQQPKPKPKIAPPVPKASVGMKQQKPAQKAPVDFEKLKSGGLDALTAALGG